MAIKRVLYFIAIFLSIAFFPSCKSLTSNRMFETKLNYDYTDFAETKTEYIIQPFDELSLKIYTNKGDRVIDIKGTTRMIESPLTYTVEFDGQVKVPTLGRVKMAGMTIREAEQFLENEYSNFFKDPFVFIEVTNKRVIIFSSGSSSGKVINFLNDNYTLIEALAQAGGISDFGKAYKIKLLRGDLNHPEVFKFNIRSLKDIKDVNFLVQSNDIIYVEDRPRYAARALQEITPYLTLFTSIFTVYLIIARN